MEVEWFKVVELMFLLWMMGECWRKAGLVEHSGMFDVAGFARKSASKRRRWRLGGKCVEAVVVLGTVLGLSTVVLAMLFYSRFHFAWDNQWKLHQVDFSASREADPMIPPIIHQVWWNVENQSEMRREWAKAARSCKKLHPGWTYFLWNAAESRKLMLEHYPDSLKNIDKYERNVQKFDAFRYLVLHKYGGFYVDLDIGCRKSLEPLRQFRNIIPKTQPIGFSNDFMAAEKNSEWINLLIESLPKWNRWWITSYFTVMISTGPIFLSFQYSLFPKKENIAVLSPKYYDGQQEHVSFLSHFAGSSWHEGDAAILLFLNSRYFMFLCIGAAFVFLLWRRQKFLKARNVLKQI